MEHLISVIVPVYNVEKYVSRCIDSILSQTYSKLEIILVNDGSLDRSGQICDTYQKKDARIQVIHQKNGGLSAARNSGINQATGDYFSFVDSDDFLSPIFIQTLYEACTTTQSEIAQCRWECVITNSFMENTKSQKLENKNTNHLKTFTNKEALAQMYEEDGAYFIVAWNKLYKKELFEEIRYPMGRIHEDEATTYRLLYQARKVVVTEEALYGYFIEGESITRNRFNNKRLDWEWAVDQKNAIFEEKGEKTLLQSTRKAYLDGCIALFFQCKTHLPDSKQEQNNLKKKIAIVYQVLKEAGGYSVRTRIGYQLFLLLPPLYKRMIARINPEGWNE